MKKPRGFNPENLVDAVLNSREKPGFTPEKVARAVRPARPEPKPKTPDLLNVVASMATERRTDPSDALSPLEKRILQLAQEQEGVLSRDQVASALRVSSWEAQSGLDRLANRGLARRVRGRHEVVYLFEKYLRRERSSSGPSVSTIFNAAVWVYGKWNDYQQSLAHQEQMLLDIAYQNRGWFTHAEAVKALGKHAEPTLERLKEAGLVEQMTGKNGQPVYVVEQFLPPAVVCTYCEAVYAAGECASCRNCGAPLG